MWEILKRKTSFLHHSPPVQASGVEHHAQTLVWYPAGKSAVTTPTHTATRLWRWFVTTETSTQSDGCCLAAMLVLAGKRPTLRSSDSQTRTQTHTHTHSLLKAQQAGWEWDGWLCVCVTALSRRGWQWRDTGEIIMSPKQGWQGAARALQLSVNCH